VGHLEDSILFSYCVVFHLDMFRKINNFVYVFEHSQLSLFEMFIIKRKIQYIKYLIRRKCCHK